MTATNETDRPTINLMAAAAWANGQPHDQFRWLREHHPVYWHQLRSGDVAGRVQNGFWAVTNYEGVHTVLRDNDTYSSLGYVGSLEVPDEAQKALSFIMLDAPRHTLVRKVISDRFTPRKVKQHVERFQQVAADIVDEIAGADRCELVQDVAGRMASYIGAELLGIPREDSVKLYRYVETLHGVTDKQDPVAVEEAQAAEDEYCRFVWKMKRADPADDVSTQLAFGSIGDQPMTEEEFVPNLGLLVHGSSDTTRNLIAGGMLTLIEHSDQQAELTNDVDGLIVSAVEEMLRWLSPVAHVYRMATRDTVLCGQEIRRGDPVIPWYGAANRDPAHFDDPERFDIRRSPNDHIAFGFSGHFCLGVHIGRLQGRTMIAELLRRVPDLELDGPVTWLESSLVSGPSNMPVRYTPPARAVA
jgi:cytochrome P450